ncbi:hypothetical protein FGO68_gene15391 [Halteria grandinella]|uniref:Uncharacterized protein n=1 Tax=Halteria grandinella TaxID=5974 RepID=A0A8J8T935_HALGN|nr:hypothetical protein FGO68_gene15391 [Halteria grandinella]
MTKFSDTVWSEIDFTLKSKITNFEVRYEFPKSNIKIAYFNWDNSKQQASNSQQHNSLQRYDNIEHFSEG